MLDVPYELVEHVSWPIYARKCERGARWRKLSYFKQAPLALAHLRKNETYQQVSYVDEILDLPHITLQREPNDVNHQGHTHS